MKLSSSHRCRKAYYVVFLSAKDCPVVNTYVFSDYLTEAKVMNLFLKTET